MESLGFPDLGIGDAVLHSFGTRHVQSRRALDPEHRRYFAELRSTERDHRGIHDRDGSILRVTLGDQYGRPGRGYGRRGSIQRPGVLQSRARHARIAATPSILGALEYRL